MISPQEGYFFGEQRFQQRDYVRGRSQNTSRQRESEKWTAIREAFMWTRNAMVGSLKNIKSALRRERVSNCAGNEEKL